MPISQFRDGGCGSVAFTVAVTLAKPNISFLYGFALTLAVSVAGNKSWAFDVLLVLLGDTSKL